YIMVMGDFNDYPDDESIALVLKAETFTRENQDSVKLFNLMGHFTQMSNVGTNKREDFWGCLDQIMVSTAFLTKGGSLHVKEEKAHIFKADFMFIPDEKYGGEKLFRTFSGPKYVGGFADHLPVFVTISLF
ncbi:MAG: hypothetical protein RR034_02370, partial [Bacteroidales bacterium]